jgi:hypothetical protein
LEALIDNVSYPQGIPIDTTTTLWNLAQTNDLQLTVHTPRRNIASNLPLQLTRKAKRGPELLSVDIEYALAKFNKAE